MNTLCIDIGNTRTKLALYNAAQLLEVQIVADNQLYEIISEHQANYNRVVLSSVKKADEKLVQLCNGFDEFIEVNHTIKLPITITYQTPHTLGKDRIALACAAQKMFPNSNTLIIALGTCITYNFINEHAQFIGGGISPGLKMRLRAMNHFTDKLPLIDLQNEIDLIGTDTSTSMQSGAFYGFLHEIEGTIAAYEVQFSKFNVVLTGGDMPQVVARLKSKIFADQNFLFSGLQTIGEYFFNPHT
jgi:type III pantothenate kinase